MRYTEFIRQNRTVHGEFEPELESLGISVFIGLYNAANYFDNIISNIKFQTLPNLPIVLADNCSSDETWVLAKQLVELLPGRAVAIRNPANVGGAGNFWSNMDLCPTDWIATLHQDDIYFENHVKSLLNLITASPNKTAIVATSMGRYLEDANKADIFPRANWLLNEDSSSVDLFLANLRNHCIPFPAAAFKRDVLRSRNIAWHDTSFPDTELLLGILAEHKVKVSKEVTMAYRENSQSESHSLGHAQRIAGQELSLNRIFLSDSFSKLITTLNEKDKDSFFRHILESISLRLGEGTESSRVKRNLAEFLAISWNYSSAAVNSFLRQEYKSTGPEFSLNFLENVDNEAVELDARGQSGRQLNVEAENLSRSPIRLQCIKRAVMGFGLRLLVFLGFRKDFDFRWRK